MNKKTVPIICILLLFGCITHKKMVIKKSTITETGFLSISESYTEFIPMLIDSTHSVKEHFRSQKPREAFYVYDLPLNQKNYLKQFGDTVQPFNFILVPVILNYELVNGQYINNEKKLSQIHSIIIDNEKFDYEIQVNQTYIKGVTLLKTK